MSERLMSERFWKAVAAIGGAAALFYALGFTVVQSYAYKNGFSGMFWLTREFYQDAGATFILDLVRVPILAPLIFFSLLLILYFIIPKDVNLQSFCDGATGLPAKVWIKIAILLGAMTLAAVFALYYDSISSRAGFAKFADFLRRSEESTLVQPERSLAFCSLITPVMAAVAIFLYRAWKYLDPKSKRREVLTLISIMYFIFLSIVPVTYGFYIYDLKSVLISDPQIKAELTTGNPSGEEAEIWFLGEFGDKYVFFRKAGKQIEALGSIETRKVEDVKRLRFDIRRVITLRTHMASNVPYKLKQERKKETMEWITEDLVPKKEVEK